MKITSASKKISVLLLVAVLIAMVGAPAVDAGEKAAKDRETLTIAYIGGLTGKLSNPARRSLRALRLVVKEFNERGGVLGKRVEIDVYDNKFSPVENISIIEKIESSDAVAITGVHVSNDALLLAEMAEKKGIPLVVASATHPDITNGKKYVSRACFNDTMQGEVLAKFACDKMLATNAAIVVDVSDSFASNLAKLFEKNFTRKGGKVKKILSIRTNDKQFPHVVEYLKGNDDIDLVFASTSALEASYLITQLSSEGLKAKLLGNDAWQNNNLNTVLKKLEQDDIEAYFTVHWHLGAAGNEAKKFMSRYEKEYGDKINSFDADPVLTYDAGKLLLTAIGKAGSKDPVRIAESIRQVSIKGVTGDIRIDSTGDPKRSIHIVKIHKGKLIPFTIEL